MAKAKKTKPRDNLPRWRVNLIKGTPAKFIDFVEAPDAKTAEEIAAKAHEISDAYGIGWWPSGRTIDLHPARFACWVMTKVPLGRARRKQQETTAPRARRRAAR